jgi:predicted metalloprotease
MHRRTFVGTGVMATPRAWFDDGPDGTVYLGTNFMNSLSWSGQFVVIAHEYGHILQYKHGMTPSGPWQMEPHADFLAGYCCGKQSSTMRKLGIDQLAKLNFTSDAEAAEMFKQGDSEFNDPGHHGQPEFRAAMVRAGFEAAFDSHLTVDLAFQKGMKIAGLS